MNILFVNKHAGDAGGVEYYINALSQKLRQLGHVTGIIHGDDFRGHKNVDHYYQISEVWDEELNLPKQTKEKLDNIFYSFLPDYIYLHNMENAEAISYCASKHKAIRYVHGYKTVDPDGKMLLCNPLEVNKNPVGLSCFLRAFTRKSMPRNIIKGIKAYKRAKKTLEATKKLKKVIVASEYMENVLVANGVRKNRINILPYFIDYAGSVDVTGYLKGNILYAGRIAEGKGLDKLLDVIKLVGQDFLLEIVGAGPKEEECRKKIIAAGLQDKVHFNGWKAHNELAVCYKRSSFLVIPSVWPEPFGICGIEAAFFAKPTIAFNVGGISEWLVDGKTGFLVEPYDISKMADRIKFLLNNPDQAIKLGEKARNHVLKKYMPDGHIKKLMEIFGEGESGN